MSRLRHKAGLPKMAGALSGVHRLDANEHPSKSIRPFKLDEEKKHGGKIHGHEKHHKLGRKRGGSVKKKSDGIVGQDGKPSEHGTGNTPDRGLKYGSHVQGVPMADGTTPRGKYGYGKGVIEDSLRRGGKAHHADGGKVKWIQHAVSKPGAETAAAKRAGMSTHAYMEKHKHDSGKAGRRARLGLTLSAMAKHKK